MCRIGCEFLHAGAGATVTAYDPVAMPEARHCFPGVAGLSYAENQAGALTNVDAGASTTCLRKASNITSVHRGAL